MFLSQGRGTVGEGQSDAHHQGAHSGRLYPAVPAVFWVATKRGKNAGEMRELPDLPWKCWVKCWVYHGLSNTHGDLFQGDL